MKKTSLILTLALFSALSGCDKNASEAGEEGAKVESSAAEIGPAELVKEFVENAASGELKHEYLSRVIFNLSRDIKNIPAEKREDFDRQFGAIFKEALSIYDIEVKEASVKDDSAVVKVIFTLNEDGRKIMGKGAKKRIVKKFSVWRREEGWRLGMKALEKGLDLSSAN